MSTEKQSPLLSTSLIKYLAQCGIGSRRALKDFIEQGEVTINEVVVTNLIEPVQSGDKVCFQGKLVKPEQKMYILLHKPKGCVTTVSDPQGRMTVMDFIPLAKKVRLYPIGRLDLTTSGILLITNDGDLHVKLSHPRYEVAKTYHVTLHRGFTQEDFSRLSEGIIIDHERIVPDKLSYLRDKTEKHVMIELHSGKTHIIKKIFEKLGYFVKQLDRVAYAGITYKNLPVGKWRLLTEQEIKKIKQL